MKRLIIIITICWIVISCSNDDSILTPIPVDKPRQMVVFCAHLPNDALRVVTYEYERNNLISETSTAKGQMQSKRTFEYDSENKLIKEVYTEIGLKIEEIYVYNAKNQLINVLYTFTNYDEAGKITTVEKKEAPREYKNDQLVKEWEHWGGFNTYEYSNGKVVTKIRYTKQGQKSSITKYTYHRGLLREERTETVIGNLLYLRVYEYNIQNRLIRIREGENIIEENDYIGNRLIEKRTYYFGMDPGFFICGGNFVQKYKY